MDTEITYSGYKVSRMADPELVRAVRNFNMGGDGWCDPIIACTNHCISVRECADCIMCKLDFGFAQWGKVDAFARYAAEKGFQVERLGCTHYMPRGWSVNYKEGLKLMED